MPKKSNGTSKSRKTNKKIKRKKRDSFVTNAVILSVIAIIIIAVSNVSEMFSDGNKDAGNNSGASIPVANPSTQESYTDGDKLCRFDFIDVGQGDSTLITTPNKDYILIDTGTASSQDKLMKHLEVSSVDEIDYLILSHPHSDHIGGAVKVLSEYDVKYVIMPDVVTTTAQFDRLYEALALEKQSGCKIYSAKPGDKYETDGCTMNIIGPLEIDDDELNNCSVSLTINYGDYDAIFTGDTEKSSEKLILSSGRDVDCELYKVAHHGSDTSSSREFIEAVTPEISVISCGKNNSYGHPHSEILERLHSIGSEIYITSELGTVTVFTDGNGYSVSTVG